MRSPRMTALGRRRHRFGTKMHRRPLIDLLGAYRDQHPGETTVVDTYVRFVEAHPDCFERSLLVGHVTASAWVLDPTREHVLLTHHAKLDRWLQLGGHADGEHDVAEAGLREAREESGIQDIRLLSPNLFDVDIHPIPEHKGVPEHLHYDARFLLQAATRDIVVSDESHELAWVLLEEVERYTDELSMLRMRDKALVWRHTLGNGSSST